MRHAADMLFSPPRRRRAFFAICHDAIILITLFAAAMPYASAIIFARVYYNTLRYAALLHYIRHAA